MYYLGDKSVMDASALDRVVTIGASDEADNTEEDVVADACVHNPDPELVDLLFWETLDLTKAGFVGFGNVTD
jgi:hypothetical protein